METNTETKPENTTGANLYSPTLHRDGTVTYWSVYRQTWVRRSRRLPDDEAAAQGRDDRERIDRHLSRGS